jgi:hypothetical protein
MRNVELLFSGSWSRVACSDDAVVRFLWYICIFIPIQTVSHPTNCNVQREPWRTPQLTFEEVLTKFKVFTPLQFFYPTAYDATFSDKQRYGRWEIENASFPILTEEKGQLCFFKFSMMFYTDVEWYKLQSCSLENIHCRVTYEINCFFYNLLTEFNAILTTRCLFVKNF